MRRWLLLASLLWASTAAAAPREVLVWHAYRDAEERALVQLLERFNASQNEFHASQLAIPYDAYPAKLNAALPTGTGPDLFVFAQERIGAWARQSLLAPLDAELNTIGPEFSEPSLAALRVNGSTWGLPLALKSPALYVNLDLVPEAPKTTDELLRIARANTGEGRYGLAYQANDFYFHAAWLHGFGGSVFREPEHVPQLDTPQAIAALTFVERLATRERVMPQEQSGQLVTALFDDGKAAMAISGPWLAGELHKVRYAVVPMPVVSETGLPARPFLTVEALVVPAKARESEGARALARFLVSTEAAVLRAREGKQVVATRSAYADPALAGDAVLAAFAKQAEQAVPMDSGPRMGAVWEPQKRALAAVLGGNAAPAEALAQAQRRLVATTREAPPASEPLPYVLLAIGLSAFGLHRLRKRLAKAPFEPGLFHVGRSAYAWVAPAAAGLLVLVFIPFGAGVGLGFFHTQDGHATFVGLRNFADILGSSDYRVTEPMSFWFTLAVTLLWTVANVALHVGIGVFFALLLRDPLLKLKGLYRVLLIVPWAVPNYITALVWKGMFHRQFGAISALLQALGIEPISWFSRFGTAFAANVVTNTWLGFPFMMVVTLGALQSIPQDLYEAAEVDGASRWAQFRHITLPLLRPALLPSVILGAVWTFNMFNVVYLVSGGEPGGSTDILVSEAYRWAFQRNEQYGFAAAYSTLIFLFLLGWSFITRRVGKDAEVAA